MAQSPDPRAVDRYKAMFVVSLSASKQEALQVLFSDGLDPMAMALDLTSFEHDTP